MATNICSKSRKKFSTVKEIAEELQCCVQQVYKLLKRSDMQDCIKKIGTAGIRVDKDKFYDNLEKVCR